MYPVPYADLNFKDAHSLVPKIRLRKWVESNVVIRKDFKNGWFDWPPMISAIY
jgi:hypothetical protein